MERASYLTTYLLQDWGITYDELEPHFDRFEYVCGTSGQAGNIQGRKIEGGNPFEAPRSREFPLPPLTNPPTSVLFAKATRDLPTPGGERFAVLHQPLRLPARTVQLLRLLQRLQLHQLIRAPRRRRTILPSLYRMPNFALRTNAHVVLKVNTDSSSGKQATGVTYVDRPGLPRGTEQPATMVILAKRFIRHQRAHDARSSVIGCSIRPRQSSGKGTQSDAISAIKF